MRLIRQVLCACLFLVPSACGKSKVEQCNAFIDRATQAQTKINGLKLDSDDAKELEKEAASIDTEATALDALSLKDEKLVGFRIAYAGTLASLGKILHELAGLQKDAKDPGKEPLVEAQLKKFGTDADQVTKTESDLVDQINGYCTGSK